jgi:hypothetical protein
MVIAARGVQMAFKDKVLWAVGYTNLAAFRDQATKVGATAVAIRTDNDIPAAVAAFHAVDVKVFGWRFPSVQHDKTMYEAQRVAEFFKAGMDGYFADPESDTSAYDNWDQKGLAPLATEFCQAIVAAAAGKPFGVTSHYRAKFVEPNLPWAAFFQFATVLLPQAYWRDENGIIGHGIPGDNYVMAITSWVQAGGAKAKIQPMGGGLLQSKAADIAAYAKAASTAGVDTVHFYTYDETVSNAVWNAIAAA